ncbi:MAG: ribonuclease III [Dehalococcoidia bacterium]|nr:ribonuclease III [Dehalococcoidia bacterium]
MASASPVPPSEPGHAASRRSTNDVNDLIAIAEEGMGVKFLDPAILQVALTHPSYANEHSGDTPETNERLEFLGDAVLGLVVAEALYARYPLEAEGRLTERRAQLVMGPTLARVAGALNLGEALLLGKGEEATGGRARDRNLERVYEAVVGALLLDQGLEPARAFIHRTLGAEVDALDVGAPVLNPKGDLQQLTQGMHARPEYVTVAEAGPEHDRTFTVEVRMDNEVLGSGSGASRQLAEKEAALHALEVLRARLASAGTGATRRGSAP